MTHIKFDYSKVLGKFLASHELDYIQMQVTAADEALRKGTGPGAEMTGWLNLPQNYDKEEFARIKRLLKKSNLIVMFWLLSVLAVLIWGARAAIDF